MVLHTASWALSTKSFSRSFSSSRVLQELSPFTRRLFNLPEAPPAPSQNHRDLQSFLTYAKDNVPEISTTFVGTRYEYTVQSSLRRFAFDLTRIGGRDDAGIDLVGTWHIPGREYAPIRIVAQCKALRTKLGPNLVRELEGAFRHSPIGWRTTEKLAMLISSREATKGVRDTLTRSPYPLFWMMMESDGAIKQVLWNSKAEDLGLAALGVEARYPQVTAVADADTAADSATTSDERARPNVVLTWDGSDIPDMERVEDRISRKEAEWLAGWGRQGLSETQKARGGLFDDVTGDYEANKEQFRVLLKQRLQ
ncbi:hypothetical protein UA08_07272 [Talaromyces atroroseus]|uniref:Restriction endonuclease type IV Mrr domain-containing protein n=1 Tax=Talaromyces atroroseus TaxID=1441469 RepID=A0A225A9M7_TALAT|nr:hypothetical protein UA08_07272 [Talaromyces atroroseus]OKL57591.1 hypothetical protein UA08_07272 [Talaromyces atroroseus]